MSENSMNQYSSEEENAFQKANNQLENMEVSTKSRENKRNEIRKIRYYYNVEEENEEPDTLTQTGLEKFEQFENVQLTETEELDEPVLEILRVEDLHLAGSSQLIKSPELMVMESYGVSEIDKLMQNVADQIKSTEKIIEDLEMTAIEEELYGESKVEELTTNVPDQVALFDINRPEFKKIEDVRKSIEQLMQKVYKKLESTEKIVEELELEVIEEELYGEKKVDALQQNVLECQIKDEETSDDKISDENVVTNQNYAVKYVVECLPKEDLTQTYWLEKKDVDHNSPETNLQKKLDVVTGRIEMEDKNKVQDADPSSETNLQRQVDLIKAQIEDDSKIKDVASRPETGLQRQVDLIKAKIEEERNAKVILLNSNFECEQQMIENQEKKQLLKDQIHKAKEMIHFQEEGINWIRGCVKRKEECMVARAERMRELEKNMDVKEFDLDTEEDEFEVYKMDKEEELVIEIMEIREERERKKWKILKLFSSRKGNTISESDVRAVIKAGISSFANETNELPTLIKKPANSSNRNKLFKLISFLRCTRKQSGSEESSSDHHQHHQDGCSKDTNTVSDIEFEQTSSSNKISSQDEPVVVNIEYGYRKDTSEKKKKSLMKDLFKSFK